MPVDIHSDADYEAHRNFATAFTLIAALCQGIGGMIALSQVSLAKDDVRIAHLMSFSTGVMLYLSFMDIMADTLAEIGDLWANLALFSGMLLFLLLEVLLPESDACALLGLPSSEEAHEKAAEETQPEVTATPVGGARMTRSAAEGIRLRSGVGRGAGAGAAAAAKVEARDEGRSVSGRNKSSIAFTGVLTAISISLHNIPEGVAVYLTCLKGVRSGLPLAIAMSLHNIPEGMAVAVPLFAATGAKYKSVMVTTASGLFEVLGALLIRSCMHLMNPFRMELMLSIVAGSMVALSLVELLPSTIEVLPPRKMALSCLAGMVFMFTTKACATRLVAEMAEGS